MSQSTLPRPATPPTLPGQVSPPAPDRTMGVLKLVVAVALTAAGVYLIFYNLGRGAKLNTTQGVFLGLILGFGLRMLLTGGAQVAGRRVGRAPSWGVFAAVVVAMGLGMPYLAQAQMKRVEQAGWDRLEASPKTFADYESYKRWTATPRKEVHAPMALAEIREELAKMEGQKTGRVPKLRGLLHHYRFEMNKHGVPEMKAAIDLARGGLAKVYAQALEDLALRVEAGPAKQEFPEDPQMRAAFAALIGRVAQSDDDKVYLVFSSENALAAMASERVPDVEGTAAAAPSDVIPAGDAFSPTRDDRRRKSFESAMEEALGKAFAEPLIRIEPLPPGADRKGKPIFQVHCATRRAPGGFVLTRDGKEVGRLFNIEVAWEFSVFDADGKLLTRTRSRSMPGEEFRFRRGQDDPPWAAYSVMMDSAYYNYCREVTGRLGLVPVGPKEFFTFEK